MSTDRIADNPSLWTSQPRDNFPSREEGINAEPRRMVMSGHSLEDYHKMRDMLWTIRNLAIHPRIVVKIDEVLAKTPRDGLPF